MQDRRTFGACVALSLFAAASAKAQTSASPDDWSKAWPPKEVLPLWPGPTPGAGDFKGSALPADLPAHFLRSTTTPTLNVFRPARPNGQALLVCPGGAYLAVSAANEGVDVARVFNAMGVTVFVLSYRLPAEGWADRADVPLQDAQRAMRLIRHRAEAFAIRPESVGVLGFSAGGHLAASLAVGHAEPVYAPVDAIDRQSARPRYAGLIYPVIAMSGPDAHARSRDALLGPAPSADLATRRSPDLNISASTPPCFIAHACDDTNVSVDNSLRMFAALRTARMACEGHFFEEGQHAFGVGRPDGPTALWPQLFASWLARTDAKASLDVSALNRHPTPR